MHEPNYLFDYSNLGHQGYLTDPDTLELLQRLQFEATRLGVLLQDITSVEPTVRNADMVSIDMAAVRASDHPASSHAGPNGMTAEHLCQLSRYIGMSDRLLATGFFEPNPALDDRGRGAHLADCLISRVQVAFPTALLVHRLDRDTSGVMVFGLTPHAQRGLSMQFEKRTTRKTYVARITGHLQPKTGEVDLPLIVDWDNRPRQKVCHETGKPALTLWRIQRYGEGETRVRLSPKTGRSHQLRVHMLALGHPIIGDPLYAPETALREPRMMLHSQELRLKHPESGKSLNFRAAPDF